MKPNPPRSLVGDPRQRFQRRPGMHAGFAIAPSLTCIVATLILLLAACRDDEVVDDVPDSADVVSDTADVVEDVPVDADIDVDTVSDTRDADGGDADDVEPDAGNDADVDAEPPAAPDVLLTFAELPAEVNGGLGYVIDDNEPVPFEVHANAADTTLDIMQVGRSGPVDWDATRLRCDTALTLEDGSTVAADAIVPADALRRAGARAWLRFGPDNGLPTDTHIQCTVHVSGPGGEGSADLSFNTRDLPDELDPFVRPDRWLLTLDRDVLSVSWLVNEDRTVTFEVEQAANGVPDWEEALVAAGILPEDNPELRQRLRSRFLTGVRQELLRVFKQSPDGDLDEDSVPIHFFMQGDPNAPSVDEFSEDGDLSLIAFAGQLPDTDLFGQAWLDANNQGAEDNTVLGNGVATLTMIRFFLEQSIGVLLFQDILPHTGTAPGRHEFDEVILADDFDPANATSPAMRRRYNIIKLGFDALSTAAAMTIAHEMGHSMGLVTPGPPPRGLFGGVDGLSFTYADEDSWHIDMPGPNVMQAGGGAELIEALDNPPVYAPLNLAYLRGRIVVGGPDIRTRANLNPPQQRIGCRHR